MITRLRRTFFLVSLCLLLPLPAGAAVLLFTSLSNASYAPGTFGRQLSLQTRWLTGSGDGPPCSDVPVDNVVLVLDLPVGTTLVSESLGSGVYDAGARTVTWQAGTVQPCVVQAITVTIDVDASVPDGTILAATATVTTSTPGDDPLDNVVTRSFVIGFQPLVVAVTFAEAECQRLGGTVTTPFATSLHCNTIKGTLYGSTPIAVVGTIANGPVPVVVRVQRAQVAVGNYLTNDDVSTVVSSTIAVTNPNPYAVRLHATRVSHTSCFVDGGTVDAYVQASGQSQFAECGFGNVSQMVEHSVSKYDAEGEPGGVCSLTVEGYSVERGSLDLMGSVPSCIEQSVGALGQRLFRLDSFAGNATQRGRGGVVTRWSIGLAGSPADADVTLMTVAAGSPVLLRLRDAAGFEVGAVDGGAGLEGRIELPGSFYSGVASDPQEIELGLPDPGSYVLDVIGTAAGPYSVTLQATDLGAVVMGELVLSGEASIGSVDSFVVVLHDNGALTLGAANLPALGQPLLLILALALAGRKYAARSGLARSLRGSSRRGSHAA